MDPLTTQLVVDCSVPLGLAQFWSMALGWTLEDNHHLVAELLDRGVVPQSETVVGPDGRLFFAQFAAIHHPRDRDGHRILFQRVPEPKTTKNRLHMDVNVGREAVSGQVDRLTELGATYVETFDRPEGYWAAMTDPEGNEFDVH